MSLVDYSCLFCLSIIWLEVAGASVIGFSVILAFFLKFQKFKNFSYSHLFVKFFSSDRRLKYQLSVRAFAWGLGKAVSLFEAGPGKLHPKEMGT